MDRSGATAILRICGRRLPARVGVLAGVCLSLAAGCEKQSMTFSVDKYINTAMQIQQNKAAEARTGEPLDVDIVCVFPKDLSNDSNSLLRPGSGITCDQWYDRRPKSPQAEGKNFVLPATHIYSLARDNTIYGTWKRGPVQGHGVPNYPEQFTINDLDFPIGWFSSGVVYVFPRFTNDQGGVLQIPPAVFNPPKNQTKVAIRWDSKNQSAPTYGQIVSAQ